MNQDIKVDEQEGSITDSPFEAPLKESDKLGYQITDQKMREKVLGRGETWLDSAFVVNDRYISAYEPIVDTAGQRVGMLYVGFLEAPFAAPQPPA